MIKTVKDLKDKLNEFADHLPVVLCDLQDDGNGEGHKFLETICSIEINKAIRHNKAIRQMDNDNVECLFINFKK